MKPDPTFWFAFSLSTILCQIEKLIGGDPHYVRKVHEDDTLNPLKSKYQEYSKEDDVFPVTFQSSPDSSYDFWRNNRRTFFEPHNKNTTPPEFYRMVTSFFGSTKSPNLFRGTYAFEKSFSFKPTEHNHSANYIPSPKPIRASVIKLETVTKSPNLYPPFYYDTATKYFPPLGNLLNHVLIENAKIHDAQDLSFHYRSNPAERVNSTSDVFLTVLPKPIEVPPTTLRPLIKFSTFFNKKKNNPIPFRQKMGYSVHKASDQRYTSSGRGQSKNFNYENIKIPYFSDTVLDTLNATLSRQQPTKISYFKNISSNRNNSSMDLKNLNWIIPNPEPIPAAISSIVKISSFDTTTLKPLQKGSKPSNKPAIEVITNFTAEGLSATKKNNANIQDYLNFYNIKNLINYDVKKMETTPKNSDEFKLHSVNFNDELSLDAKILKDTNWDNLSTSKSTILLENQRGTLQTKNKIDEKEIITTEKLDETILTGFSDYVKLTTTFIPPTVEDIFENTTRIDFPTKIFLKSTKFNTNEMFSTTKNLYQIPSRYDTVSETTQTNSLSYVTTKETTQEPVIKSVSEEQIIETTTVSTILSAESVPTTFPKRNYRRRSKVVNSALPPDFQKKELHRNNFPKRPKPNITLTFGNKINVKSREEYERDIMKFSGDVVGKRKRKSGKRRRVIRVQIPKVEKPVSNTESTL